MPASMRFALAPVIFLLLTAGISAPVSGQPGPAAVLGPVSPRTGLLLTDDATVALIQHSSGDLAHQSVAALSSWSRVIGTPQYQAAAEWLAQKASEAGLSGVEIEHYAADGKTRYFDYQSERFWKVRSGELWVESPFAAKITSFAELPVSLCRNSVSADVTAALVDIGEGASDNDYRKPVKGCVVLTTADPGQVADRAVYKEGALGIVSSWNIPEWDRMNRLPGDSPDLVGWRYLPDPGDRKGTFAFLVSPRRGRELLEMLRAGQTVRVRAKVDAEVTSGNLDVVTGTIPGSRYAGEEIVVTSHLDEIGADDNASGNAVMLEMARTLSELVASGKIPPPLRTIRFLWGPEFAGSFAWLSRHLNEPVKRVANLNFDQMGANLLTVNTVMLVSYTPDSVPSYLNAVMESIFRFMNAFNDSAYPHAKEFHIISVNGSRNRLSARVIPFIAGSDSVVYNHAGIPGAFVTAWPESFYHSNHDTPDKVDPTQLHRGAFAGLAAIATLAYMTGDNAEDLALLTFAHARMRIGEGESLASKKILAAPVPALPDGEYLARKTVQHLYAREGQAIRSCAFFARSEDERKAIERLAATLAGGEEIALKQVRDLAVRRAERLGISFRERLATPAEQRASRLFPATKPDRPLLGTEFVFGQLSETDLAGMKSMREEFGRAERAMRFLGDSDLRIMGFADAAASYADGRRSILDIRDEIAAEYTYVPVEALELYFRAFEKAGVMTIREH